mmetsp:Transcript_9578/g.33057  ORF Transcript_9578/g.33057 Transcript_9578/m.33057 type:complete len:220 (+) Transcript_9578:1429-2088(+)
MVEPLGRLACPTNLAVGIFRKEREEGIPIVDHGGHHEGVEDGVRVPVLLKKFSDLLQVLCVPDLLGELQNRLDVFLRGLALPVPHPGQEVLRLVGLLGDPGPLLLEEHPFLLTKVEFQKARIHVLNGSVKPLILAVHKDLGVSAPRHGDPHPPVQPVRQALAHHRGVVHHAVEVDLLHVVEAALIVVLVKADLERQLLAQPLVVGVAAGVPSGVAEAEL